MMITHLEVMQRELKIAQDLIKEYHNLLVDDSLIDLATRLQLQNQALEAARTTLDYALSMIRKVHKELIEKYGLLLLIPP